MQDLQLYPVATKPMVAEYGVSADGTMQMAAPADLWNMDFSVLLDDQGFIPFLLEVAGSAARVRRLL